MSDTRDEHDTKEDVKLEYLKSQTDLAQISPLRFSVLQFQLNGLKCILMFCVT